MAIRRKSKTNLSRIDGRRIIIPNLIKIGPANSEIGRSWIGSISGLGWIGTLGRDKSDIFLFFLISGQHRIYHVGAAYCSAHVVLAWSVCLSVCLCVLGALVSYAKTSEPLQILSGRQSLVCPRNHELE